MYQIHHTTDIAKMEEGRIALNPWKKAYEPDARFYVGWTEDALHVFLRAYEVDPVADKTERNSSVCCDSCLEFFFSPSTDCSNGYFNFEMNANPTLLLHYGLENRKGRVCVDWPLEAFRLTCERGEDAGGRYWQTSFIAPLDMIRHYIPGVELYPGKIIRANVYKCGDTRQPNHYMTWSPVDTRVIPNPDFHQPNYFGQMVLAED